MSPGKQWISWLKVLLIMSVFTFLQVPLSQYALGKTDNSPANWAPAAENGLISVNYQSLEEYRITRMNAQSDSGSQSVEPAGLAGKEHTEQEIEQQEGQKAVYLTIDDGPGGVSAKFLDILAKYEVKVTFFLLEPRVKVYSEEVIRMAREGHALGCHGVTHAVGQFYGAVDSAVREFNQTKAALREATGQDYHLVRTPYGSVPYLAAAQEKLVVEAGYRIWDWNVDSRDWYYRDEEYVLRTIEQVDKLAAQGIEPVILIHELETTAEHLEKLIEHLLAQGFEFKTLALEQEPVRLR
ncbi:MAG: polysaccharide deacetylase family protein [Desulfitobacteriia bacterium]|jgi:peptidoglycan/xylan/chitin deacetylase (PgdA/CDA1 family)